MENVIEDLKRQISEVQKIDGWYPLICHLLEFVDSCPFSSGLKGVWLQVFYCETVKLMNHIIFDKNELSETIEEFKRAIKSYIRDGLIDLSDQIRENPDDRIESVATSIHGLKRKKILESLGGEKLSEWEEILLKFYSNEVENFNTISTLKRLIIKTKNEAKNRKYHGEETQLEGFSKNRWALVLWYESNGKGILAKNSYYKAYMTWKDEEHRIKVNPKSNLGTDKKIEHYKWAIPQITNPIQKKIAEEVLQNIENELNEIKRGK